MATRVAIFGWGGSSKGFRVCERSWWLLMIGDSVAVCGQMEHFGRRGARSDGVGVCWQPWRRPHSGEPAAMVEAHQVVMRI